MNERMRESLSALMDGEANEMEMERVLAQLSDDSGLRQSWLHYNLAQQAVHGHGLAHLEWDVSVRVRRALADSTAGGAGSGMLGLKQRMLRPVVSFAIAASVAVTVVLGGRQLAQLEGSDPNDANLSVATSASPVGMLNSLGATAMQASYGTQPVPVLQPATRTAYQELAQQRLRRYMQEHAEQAALNSPQGLVPFVRVPQIRE